MGLANPPRVTAVPFKDVMAEGEPFILDGIRTVSARTDYGEGEMVLLKVRGREDELSLWGKYLIHQAAAAESSDFGRHYIIEEKVVDGFSSRPVKCLTAANEDGSPIPF